MNLQAKYLLELGERIKLSPEEELQLIRLSKKGNKEAENKLIKANLKFVVSIANKYHNNFLTLGDLVNEGNLGMVEAIQNFDEKKDVKFITYASYWIRQSIIKAIQDYSSTVRLPLQVRASIRKYENLLEKVENTGTVPPSSEEVIKELELTEDAFKILQELQSYTDSLDHKVEDGQDGYETLILNVYPSPDNGLMRESLNVDLKRVFSRLNENEIRVLTLFYGLDGKEPYFIEDIGKSLGISSERARQIRENALKKLRRCKLLKKYDY